MTPVTISGKYRVVIPRDVQERLTLRPGQQVEAFAVGGRIELVPVRPVGELRGREAALTLGASMRQGKLVAAVRIGLGEPVDQASFRRGKGPDTGGGVKPLQGERSPGTLPNKPLETRAVLDLNADGAVEGISGLAPASERHASVRQGPTAQSGAQAPSTSTIAMSRAFRVPRVPPPPWRTGELKD